MLRPNNTHTSLLNSARLTAHPPSILDVRTQCFRIQFEGFTASEYERCDSVAINKKKIMFFGITLDIV